MRNNNPFQLSHFFSGMLAAVLASTGISSPFVNGGPSIDIPLHAIEPRMAGRKPSGGGAGSRRHRQWKRRRAAGWDRHR